MVFVWHIASDPVGSLLWAIVLLGLSGLPGLLLKRTGPGQALSVIITLSAAVWGMAGALRILAGAPATRYLLDWPLPFGPCELSVDPLSALFLLPLLLAAACCSLYGSAYLPAAAQPAVEKKVTLFSGLLVASMALFVLFSLLRGQTGSFTFPAAHSLATVGPLAMVMLLAALIGFGAKAGIMPLHIWLPGAHANAPSHVSALMSGIMLKVGVYGIIRTVSFFHDLPVWLGWLVLLLGGGFGSYRHCAGILSTGSETSAGLQQYREHRHHLYRSGHGPGGGGWQ